MYNKILADISQDYYTENYSNDGQRFVAWYLRNIHGLNPVEAKSCITDGANDKQIDAVYIDNDSSIIYIIQGKFYSGETVNADPLREVLSAWVHIKNLEELQDGANDKLKCKISEIATALEDDYEIIFELITASKLTETAKKDLITYQREISENESISANLHLIDRDVLKFKYDEALDKNRPYINHDFKVDNSKCMELTIGGIRAVIAVIPLNECIKIPGIVDGSLFRKNVRQSLGSNNKINKGIASTLKKEAKDFFFYHNGITAICSKIVLGDGCLSVKELNVVNGCQSLSTINSCSESVRNATDGYIMFRFYEISNAEKADKISTSTNSQSTVKARDLRSNDKFVIAMKKAYEQCYTDGYFCTKRGELKDVSKYNKEHIVDLTDLGKQLIAWHSQRPTISYSETRIFDKYFAQIFRKEYAAENIQALNELYNSIISKWSVDNPLDLTESLLAMKAYAPYHHLYAISMFFCEVNNKMTETVPNPAKSLELLKKSDLLDTIVRMSGECLNMAFETAYSEAQDNGKVFSPQNWIKNKASLKDIKTAIKNRIATLKYIPESQMLIKKINSDLKMAAEDFESRWSAD